MHFVGCEKAHEVSLTRGKDSAANPMASVLLFKSLSGGVPADPSNPSPEHIDMDAAELKKALDAAKAEAQTSTVTKLLGMSDVAKAHFSALTTDETRSAFLAKSIDEMNAEAAAAKTAVETEKARQDAAKTAVGADVAEIVKMAVAPFVAQITELTKKLGERESADVFKARAQKDFAGHPQGEEHVIGVLKSIAALPEDTQKSIEGTLTQAINLAKYAGIGHVAKAMGVEAVASDSESAMTVLKAKAKELKKSVTEVSEMPEYADLHAAAMKQG